MSVVVEREEWLLSPFIYGFLFICCLFSLFLLPYFSRREAGTSSPSLFDVGPSTAFFRFQKRFLLLYSLASAMQGFESVYGGYEFTFYHVMNRDQLLLTISGGVAVSIVLGTFIGILSDIFGSRNSCILFFFCHILTGTLKSVANQPNMFVSIISIGIASTLYPFCFETWMVIEHEKQGHMTDFLSDTFWLMTLFEPASLIGSQGLANILTNNLQKPFIYLYAPIAFCSFFSILYIRKEWNGNHQKAAIAGYQKSFTGHILADNSIWMLGWAQASLQFSLSVFWILWAPTIVADGRDVQLSHIYPCFLGSRMLGSTVFPWLSSKASPLHSEVHNSLIAAFVIAGLILLTVAYDYQDIGVLVVLFSIFHACIGLISPSLAWLRTIYVPNELRGGMISASLVPANAAFLFVLVFGGYYRSLGNAAIMAMAAVGLLSAAGCIYALRWRRRHLHQSWHEL